ncbi:DUF397 domain-containing protein [Streptomyces agglomeratus]|uniref:DUF397 domain-containing protein n=1 Tax=Streptomyces agglomeratus TaxID=285458 RepID=UPI0008540C52|nr:DUF397 domain-containing protein [Streptomyces agglomeratus]OEJ37867.1 DUF397 domain-containing protein [Streptomyces agglomeratus]OEJ47748.1 DUF397 domain-containing protein [Streptomyces agglomeratus]
MSAPLAHVPSSTDLYGARWRRSSRSTGMNNCVETARVDGGLLAVRDSKHVTRPALLFGADTWTSFLTAVRDEALGGAQRRP